MVEKEVEKDVEEESEKILGDEHWRRWEGEDRKYLSVETET